MACKHDAVSNGDVFAGVPNSLVCLAPIQRDTIVANADMAVGNKNVLQEEGSMPSVLGEKGGLLMITLMITFSQNSGLILKKGEFTIVTPSLKYFYTDIEKAVDGKT